MDVAGIITTYAPQITYTVGLIVGLVLIRLVHRAGKKAGLPGLHAIRDIMTIIWAAFLGLAILRFAAIPGVDLTTLSFSAILGLAVSLALQNTLQNMISSLFLFRDKAIRLHDEISCSGVRGTVVSQGLRNVWIRSSDGSYALISNSTLASGPLINHTALKRIKHKIEEE